LCCVALVSACSKDDNSDNSNDKIVGKWYLASFDGGAALPDASASDCNKQSYIDFKSDGTAGTAYYSDNNGECTSETSSSTWQNLGNSKYKFVIPVYDLGAQSGTVEFNGSSSFTFHPDLFPGASIVFEKR
ncbi:MAG: lipocalin family protein, partial [Gillisia sp.]